MKTSTMLLFAVVAIVFIAALVLKTKRVAVKTFSAKAKKPLSTNEQPMYFKLLETFPDLVVLAQVSFSALLQSSIQADRNKFNRKMADFVLCTRAFDVVAIVELDDSSHRERSKEDGERDVMLISAGHRVIRFKKTPNTDELLKSVFPPVTVIESRDLR